MGNDKKITWGGVQPPEEYVYSLIKLFRIDGSLGYAKISLITVLLSGIAAYHLHVINGHGNPDAICEGLVSYTGEDWALASGRWATRYLNEISFDIILPGIWIALYMLAVFTIVILLAKMWQIRSKVSIALISALLAVNPAVIERSLLQYMFLAWGVSDLLSVLFVYLLLRCKSKVLKYCVAPVLMAISFGLYQVSVGTISLCFAITVILDALSGDELKDIAVKIVSFILSSLIGLLLYFVILNYELNSYSVMESGRVQAFSIAYIFKSLLDTIPQSYEAFYAFFADHFFYRKPIYTIVFFIAIIFFLISLIDLLRRKALAEAVTVSILFCLLPLCSNVTKVIFPDTEIKTLMQYQNMLMVPFAVSLIEGSRLKWQSIKNCSHCLTCLAFVALIWGYTVSANATYSVYELTYRHTYFMTESILNRVYSMPEYSEGDTVIFAGFIDDTELRGKVSAYKFAYGQYDNLVFWQDAGTGLRESRNNYLLNYFGFSGGYIHGMMHGAYNEAVTSAEYEEMGIFPAQDSIRKFGDMIIVKLSDDPPLFD